MFGNEAAIPSGRVEYLYAPQNQFIDNERQFLNVSNVQWITTLRHPYSRTLSHYHHAIRNKPHHNLTLEEFLTQPYGNGFHKFIPNQMTRWHCGTGPCVSSRNKLLPSELQHAMNNLQKMHAVLILEDFSDADSCTRRQMRHVLKFDQLEAFDSNSQQKQQQQKQLPQQEAPPQHRSDTNWEEAIRPYLDDSGYSTNNWSLQKAGDGNRHNSSNGNTTGIFKIMASMGVHNDYDLQLYGYARHLCHILADKYDRQEEAAAEAVRATISMANATATTMTSWDNAKTTPEPPLMLAKDFSGPPLNRTAHQTNNVIAPLSYQQPTSISLLMMYVVCILGFVTLSQQRRQRTLRTS